MLDDTSRELTALESKVWKATRAYCEKEYTLWKEGAAGNNLRTNTLRFFAINAHSMARTCEEVEELFGKKWMTYVVTRFLRVVVDCLNDYVLTHANQDHLIAEHIGNSWTWSRHSIYDKAHCWDFEEYIGKEA